jgi:hypothetical protein
MAKTSIFTKPTPGRGEFSVLRPRLFAFLTSRIKPKLTAIDDRYKLRFVDMVSFNQIIGTERV